EPTRALAYFDAAMQQGLDTPALRFMVARASRALGGRLRVFECPDVVKGFAYDRATDRVIAGCGDHAIVWDASSGSKVATVAVPGALFVRVSHDGRSMMLGGSRLVLADARTGAILHELRDAAPVATMPSFSSDDSRVAAIGAKGVARVWDVAS